MLSLLLRIPLGLILLATGLGKLLDVQGFKQVLGTYQFFPSWALAPVAVAFVLVELKLAELLLLGKRIYLAAVAATLLHVAFVFWAAMTLLRGIQVPNCGCFGVFWARPLTWMTVAEDFVLFVWSFALWQVVARKSH